MHVSQWDRLNSASNDSRHRANGTNQCTCCGAVKGSRAGWYRRKRVLRHPRRTPWCESAHAAVLAAAEKTSSSSKRFICHWLWGSDPSHKVLEYCSPDSSRCIHRDHDTGCIFAPRPQSFDAAAGDHNAQTALRSTQSKWLTRISAKSSAGACIENCPVWNGALQTNWRPSASKRGERASPLLLVKAQKRYRLTRGKNALTHIHT